MPDTTKLPVNRGGPSVHRPTKKEDEDRIVSPRPDGWSAYFVPGPTASSEFMENIEQLPQQDRQ
jgi:virulence-associated protein VagC